nr:hypothetical protein [Deltaproteobacteria bacterium]
GRVLKKIDANKKPTTYTYENKTSRVKSETDALGNVVEYAYGPDGNVTLVAERATEVRYNPTKDFQRQEFESYRASTMTYDALGRMIKLTMPGDQEVQYAYDSLGRVMGAQYKNGRKDLFTLDGLGRVKQEKQYANLSSGMVTIERKHDLLDRELSMKASRGGRVINSVSRKYTPYGKVKEKTVNGVTTKYTFDDRGLLKKEELPNGYSVTYTYDEEGRMTKLSADDGGAAGTREETFEYDGLHRVTKASRYGGFVTNKLGYDSLGNVLFDEQILKGSAYKFEYEYDNTGLKKSLKIPKLVADTSSQTL